MLWTWWIREARAFPHVAVGEAALVQLPEQGKVLWGQGGGAQQFPDQVLGETALGPALTVSLASGTLDNACCPAGTTPQG